MKVFTGKVIKTNMQKTATVAVERIVAHPLYKKRLKRIKKYQVHDEVGVKVNDVVSFVASKPYSKVKKWKIITATEEKKDEPKKKVTARKGKK